MQNFEILLNNSYTASTQANIFDLDLINDYYVYITRNGGGIVNKHNVRGYLNDPRNQQIINDFFAYLAANTSQDQELNILGSDKKLSDVFNDYYQRIILSGSQSFSTAVISQNLTGGSQIVGYTFNHPWNGYSPSKQLTGITQDINGSTNFTNSTIIWDDFTTEQSYFIPVYLERSTNQLARYTFDVCDVVINKKTAGFYPDFSGITGAFFGFTNSPIVQDNSSNSIDTIIGPANFAGDLSAVGLSEILDSTSIGTTIGPANFGGDLSAVGLITSSSLDLSSAPTTSISNTRIHTLLSCFVDVNLETNENVEIKVLPKVSFQFSQYDVNEGSNLVISNFVIRVDLNSTSVNGSEEVTVQMILPPFNALSSNFNTLKPGTDFTMSQTYPITLKWAIGEQYKNLSFATIGDLSLENTESFSLKLINPINVDIGAVESTVINIIDTTDPDEAIIEAGQGRG